MWSENGQPGLGRFCFIHLGLQNIYIFAMPSTITAAVSCVSVCRLCCASLPMSHVCYAVCLHGHPHFPCFAKGGLQAVTKQRLTTYASH